MKLVLEDPTSFPVQMLSAPIPITETAELAKNDLVLVMRPFDPLLHYWLPWKTAMIDWGKPSGGSVDVVTEVRAKTRAEWPIEIIDSLVKDAAGKVVEARLTVLYFFLEWCTMAVVCARPDKLAAERDRALELLRSGRPDWSGPGIAAIAQLYE